MNSFSFAGGMIGNSNRAFLRILDLLFIGVFFSIGLLVWRAAIETGVREDAKHGQREWRASGPVVKVALPELLVRGSNYHGKKIETIGYVRYVTLIMGRTPETQRTLYALSPEPINLARREKGGLVGETAVTNLMIHTTEWLNGFSDGAETNITPRRTVVGAFRFDGKFHNLSLLAWTADRER